jgi:hypothetical protein
VVLSLPLDSRNHFCRPGRNFRDGINLAGWDKQSFWGYDTGLGSFFAQLWSNDSNSDPPELWLSGAQTPYPWPGGIVLEIVERLTEDPLAVVRALGLADPNPALRLEHEIMQRIRELAELGPRMPYIAGQIRALGWIQGLVNRTPGSWRRWRRTMKPSPAQVDAEHRLVTGRIYRGESRDLYSGADEALWWALARP